MTAQQAKIMYGGKFKSMKQKGSTVSLKNSMGKVINVSKNTKVYHRGKGKFGIYSATEDAKRSARKRNVNRLPPKARKTTVGYGAYRHTHDGM